MAALSCYFVYTILKNPLTFTTIHLGNNTNP
jgi:hypothetical protein